MSAHKTNCRKRYAFLIRTKRFKYAENDKIVPSYFEYYLNDTKNSYYEFHRHGFRVWKGCVGEDSIVPII